MIIAANWKMNLGRQASVALSEKLRESFRESSCQIWLTPSFTGIEAVKKAVAGSSLKVGAQNAHWAESGAFTGEVSCGMLKEIGADYVIIGHSERRHIFLETNEIVNKRAEAVLQAGLGLIFCIGETLEQRESGETERVLESQLLGLLKSPALQASEAKNKLVLAYEPVWAIGTGKVASTDEIHLAHKFISEHWRKESAAESPKILYGGSVSPENFSAIAEIENVSGALIGGASNKLESLSEIIRLAEKGR